MKKLALTIVCAVAITGGVAFAQGTIAYTVISPAGFTVQTNANFYSPLFGGGATSTSGQGKTAITHAGFYYELLYNTAFNEAQVAGTSAPSNSYAALFSTSSPWLDATLSATNAGSLGLTGPIAPSAAATVPWERPTTNNIIMVGWSSSLGTSWSVVAGELQNWATVQGNFSSQNNFFGVSAAGWIYPATGSPGATIFNGSPNGAGLPINSLLTQLYLLPVPEPSTMVLVGLGGLSLLLFRRRK